MISHVFHVLPAFLLACLVLAALPGPATALFLHRTVRDGRRAGLAAVAGNEIGVFCWAIAGGAGLSVLLAANRVLFDGLHLAGALVLVALGIQAWRGAGAGDEDAFNTTLSSALPVVAHRPRPFARLCSLLRLIPKPQYSRCHSSRNFCHGMARCLPR